MILSDHGGYHNQALGHGRFARGERASRRSRPRVVTVNGLGGKTYTFTHMNPFEDHQGRASHKI